MVTTHSAARGERERKQRESEEGERKKGGVASLSRRVQRTCGEEEERPRGENGPSKGETAQQPRGTQFRLFLRELFWRGF